MTLETLTQRVIESSESFLLGSQGKYVPLTKMGIIGKIANVVCENEDKEFGINHGIKIVKVEGEEP